MAAGKKLTLKKLKRKRFWPSVIMFLAFAMVSVALVFAGLQLISNYILGTRISTACSQAMDTGVLMERCVKEKGALTYAVNYASRFREERSNVCITDKEGNSVINTSEHAPDLDLRYTAELGEKYELYPDKKDSTSQVFQDIDILDLIRRTFYDMPMDESRDRGAWMRETVIEEEFWVKAHWDIDEYDLYVEESIQLQRQDIYYISRLGLITLVILLIPLMLMFINTVTNIYTQRATTKLLYTDAVTGGHNWIYFQGAAQKTLEAFRNARRPYALVNLHLVHYANYVNCYGSEEGENLLECMDGFLRARMGMSETFGHNGGADFGLILRCQGADETEWKSYCQNRLRSLLAELSSLQPERKLHFHAGVYMIPPAGGSDRRINRRKHMNINQMFSYASVAQRAECNGKEQIFFFDTALLEAQNWEQWVENHMQTALTSGEFEVYYQPKYAPASGRLVGAEALVRWNCPDRGVIPPGKFIPIFEANGFIMKLDDYMIAKVAKQQVEWAIQGKKTVPVSVNISRIHFSLDDLAEHIVRMIDAYGARHELIELEVTESAFFDDKQMLIETVSRLRAYGFPVSMDDFGAGYSSLNSLKDIPLDIVKLDAEFFRGEDVMNHGRVIVKEAVSLAHQLNMRVVAEGIEQKEQVDFLAGIGCDMIQGYYYAKPMQLSEFEQRIERDA